MKIETIHGDRGKYIRKLSFKNCFFLNHGYLFIVHGPHLKLNKCIEDIVVWG